MFHFGDFRFDLEARLLTHGARRLELAPKALEVLAVLVKNANCVVRKDDLLSLIWPQTFVEEGNLAVYVSSLRKVLAEHGDVGNYIEAVPKQGYRFVAPGQSVVKAGAIARNDASALLTIRVTALAVCNKTNCCGRNGSRTEGRGKNARLSDCKDRCGTSVTAYRQFRVYCQIR